MSKKCVLIVLSNPITGRETEFNDWYSNQHLADVLKVPGFISAQRFELGIDDSEAAWKYLAIYEFASDHPAELLEQLKARAGTAEMAISQAMDMSSYSVMPWVSITEKLTVA